jgi:hypothetical protein
LLRPARLILEIAFLTALILAARCANYQDVFVGGKIYFLDADCYARMSRARIVVQHPGTVVRHHDFENYTAGTSPHTTAPLDYAIAAVARSLGPFTVQPLDLAGAIISPLLALGGGWFLCWWSRRLASPYRWTTLLLYAGSPILAHGTALGRPDHQGLLIVLLLLALVAEWELLARPSRGWAVVSGSSWGMAVWVSFYEPLLLLSALLIFYLFRGRKELTAPHRRIGWCLLAGIVLLAALVERRWPHFPNPALRPFFAHWSATIGELKAVGLTNPIWLHWFGALILVAPVLIFLALKRRTIPPSFALLLGLTLLLTIWQARWGYFFGLVFALTIPAQLEIVRRSWLGWLMVTIALLPLLQDWDEQLWPNDQVLARRAQDRIEAVEWRAAATSLASDNCEPLLAPWWLSPAAAYWSGQPAIAGSSHESLAGIVESARFFLATQPNDAREILRQRGVKWVLAYDADRVAQNSAQILGLSPPEKPLCVTLDRSPSRAPEFLVLAAQNRSCKVYRVSDERREQ